MRFLLFCTFFVLASCRTGGDGSSELKTPGLETCPSHEGLGLLGDDQRKFIRKKKDEFDTINRQCYEAATLLFDNLSQKTAYRCSCIHISGLAYLYAEEKKKKEGHKGEAVECFRHVRWQAHLSCRWGDRAARVLGDVREKGSRAVLDTERDQYHNRLGRLFISAYRKKLGKEKLGKCRERSIDVAEFVFSENLCAKLSGGKVSKTSDAEMSEAYERFSRSIR